MSNRNLSVNTYHISTEQKVVCDRQFFFLIFRVNPPTQLILNLVVGLLETVALFLCFILLVLVIQLSKSWHKVFTFFSPLGLN